MVFAMLIGIVIFLVVIMVAFSFFSEVFEDMYYAVAEQFEAQKNRSTNRAGSLVCDMRVEVHGAFDEAPFGFDLELKQRLYLGVGSPNSGGIVYHPEVMKVDFKECAEKQDGIAGFIQSVAPTFTVEKFDRVRSTLLAFTNITPQEFTVDMEFFRVDDGTSIGIKTVRKDEPAGAKLPLFYDKVFVFQNIEFNEYDVHITCSGDCTKINNLPSGEPYIYKIRN